MRTRLVSWLLRLYPRAWRAEYGAELSGMLLRRPISAAIVVDVAMSALWQRVRAMEASTVAGIGLMLVTTAALVWNIIAPPAAGFSERIDLLQRPMRSELYVLVMACLGFWSASRGNRWPGRAAIRASIIASIPLVVVGVLMWAGILGFVELSPGQSPISTDGGIVYAFYKGQQQIPGPAPLVMLLSPLLRLPGAWMWGSIGGWLGKTYANWRRRPISV
jgi:hypothetical protein